ncbi:MAG: EAL domain-containing protein [Campylobacterales bacterium]|nr:EAL domain-containing protein [Campylobacterales bacterium]
MEHKSLWRQHLIVTTLITLFIGLLGYVSITLRIQTLTYEKYLEVSKEMRGEAATLIAEKKEAMLYIALTLANDTSIRDALIHNRPEVLDLHRFVERLSAHTSIDHIQFHVVGADARSFYRSWTTKKGDDLSSVRKDLVALLQEPRAGSLVSVGIYDITFKAMVPIYHEEKLIGVIEAISKTGALIQKIRALGMDAVLIVDERYTPQLTYPFTDTFIANYYVATADANPKIMSTLHVRQLKRFINHEPFITLKQLALLGTTYTLFDVANDPMAYLLLFKPIPSINFENIGRDRYQLGLIFLILYIVAIALYYYIYILRESSIIQKMNVQLESMVEEKTQTLQYLAHYDTLTMLPNRLLFIDRLNQGIKHAKRYKTTLYLLFLDLDRFKEVNDSFGHDAGDELLRVIAQRLKGCLREEDTVARLGGDEFTILLAGVAINEVHTILTKILGAIAQPVAINALPTYTTFSIGISHYPDDGTNAELLLRNADTAMYRAKELGKNRFQFYDPNMTRCTLERFQKDSRIRSALEHNELEPFFQPQIDARSGKVVGAEALIRWRDPKEGLIAPALFIPLAEETGFITVLDSFMMQSTLERCTRLLQEGQFEGTLSLNLSVKQLEKPGFVDELRSYLYTTTFPAHLLELEVTESQLMKNPESAITLLKEIKSLGVSIAVDDFGTGYSSLSYLKKLPIDKLKIDRSFIVDLPHDSEDAAIVRAIIALAKSLKLELIAEGVENEAQQAFLLQEGCSVIQGYMYAKPLCYEEFAAYLATSA